MSLLDSLLNSRPTPDDVLRDSGAARECDRLRGVLEEASAIIDSVAAIMGISEPAHALPYLTADEQARLYALLKGGEE